MGKCRLQNPIIDAPAVLNPNNASGLHGQVSFVEPRHRQSYKDCVYLLCQHGMGKTLYFNFCIHDEPEHTYSVVNGIRQVSIVEPRHRCAFFKHFAIWEDSFMAKGIIYISVFVSKVLGYIEKEA